MNNLEGLVQSILRRVDAQSSKSALPSNEGDQIKGASDASTFDLLIRTLSAKGSGQPLPGSQGKSFVENESLISAATTIGGKFHKLHDDREEPLLDLLAEHELPETLTNENVQLQSVFPLPQGVQDQKVVSTSSSPLREDNPRSLLDMIRMPAEDDIELGTSRGSAARPELKVSVLHQETHFKPIHRVSLGHEGQKLQNASLLTGASLIATKPQAQAGAATEPEQTDQDEAGHIGKLRSRDGGTQLPSVNSGEHTSDVPQSNTIVQRIATTIAAFAAREAAETNAQEPGSSFNLPVTSVKASEGALRALDIQLRPAELGVVTVRMRLNGDSIEMELHTSESETAELLRKDSEKLASLLRTSGYRPDVITIHTAGADASQQNGPFSQRQPTSHSGSQFGGSEGGDTRQEGQSRKGDSHQRGQRNETGEVSNRTGGRYL